MPSTVSYAPWLMFAITGALGLMIGLSKGGLSGLSLLLTPIMTLLVQDVALAVALLLPMLLVGDALAILTYWREWEHRTLLRVLPAAMVGAGLGIVLLTALPPNTIKALLALFALLAVAYKLATDKIRKLTYRPRPWHGLVAGGITGLASGMFNAGGPPLNAYMLFQGLPPRIFVGTTTVVFALLNIIKLAVLVQRQVLDAARLQLALEFWWVVVFIPIGNWLGRRLVTRVEARVFDALVSLLLVVSAVWLLWESL